MAAGGVLHERARGRRIPPAGVADPDAHRRAPGRVGVRAARGPVYVLARGAAACHLSSAVPRRAHKAGVADAGARRARAGGVVAPAAAAAAVVAAGGLPERVQHFPSGQHWHPPAHPPAPGLPVGEQM